MSLSNDLILEFAKTAVVDTNDKGETTVYGTVVKYDGGLYVRLDGSDRLTPMNSTVNAKPGDRVMVLLKNHSATITGNVTTPSAGKDELEDTNNKVEDMGDQITEFEIAIGNKVDVIELDAERARIDELFSENVTIKDTLTANKAVIDSLEADNVVINEKLTATTAEIDDLKATKLDTEIADIKFATIENLDVTNANIHSLEATYGEFADLTTKNFTAVDANIKRLDTEKLSAKDADLKYANIDFSNINKASIENFFAKSGMIGDLVVGEGSVTGTLVGVTIKGDLIEGGTVKADKLVIKGADGLYYKLNTDGESVSSEQTEYNSLNGSVITAKSITAEKVNVNDLVAFDATIGGFKITSDSIYSGVKESIDNTTQGLYLDKSGQMVLGDSNNFLKYYKDENGGYKLEISASSVTFSSSKTNVESALTEVQDAVDKAIKSSVEEFYKSSSPTELLDGEWSAEQPTWEKGKYIWRRTLLTYTNGKTEYSPSQNGICITGNTGDSPPLVHIYSSRGVIFKNNSLATSLIVTIIIGDLMIESSEEMYKVLGNSAKLTWESKSIGEELFTPLEPTDSRISDNGFILTINPDSVREQIVFNCKLDY